MKIRILNKSGMKLQSVIGSFSDKISAGIRGAARVLGSMSRKKGHESRELRWVVEAESQDSRRVVVSKHNMHGTLTNPVSGSTRQPKPDSTSSAESGGPIAGIGVLPAGKATQAETDVGEADVLVISEETVMKKHSSKKEKKQSEELMSKGTPSKQKVMVESFTLGGTTY